MSPRSPLDLRRYLAARMLPIAALLALVIASVAPLAYLYLTFESLRTQAAGAAAQIADVIRREVEERPILWRYTSVKLLDHVRAVADPRGVAAIAVVDRDGAPQGLGQGLPPPGGVLWAAAPLVLHGDPVADVWVAVDPAPAITGALRLFAGAGPLALLLALLVYWLPVRAIARAEARIGGLVDHLARAREALAELNVGLEGQVAARSAELSAAYDALRQVAARAIALQEAERRVIARELHDSAGQALTAIRIHLQLIIQGAERPPELIRLAERALTITDATLEEIRRAVVLLGPAILDDVGLVAALGRLCDDLLEDGTVRLEADIQLPPRGLGPALESAIYRICQEALTNVVRHAAARQVTLRASVDERAVHLEIADDGRGFDPSAVGARSRGLLGIRERVELLGGAITITSAPGRGAQLRAELPRLALSSDGDDSALVIA
jgi:signal transduction histidine kinase